MDKLLKLLTQARDDDNAMAEWRGVVVEYNGGIPIYSIDGIECTASQAITRLDELSA